MASEKPPLISRYTYRGHVYFELLNGIFFSIIGFKDVVARKTLLASEWQIVILASAMNGFFIFGYLISRLMEGRSKKPFILFSAYLGRAIFLLVLFIASPWYFIIVCCISFFAESVFHPAWTSVMQANYHPDWQGRLNGKVAAYASFSAMVTALGIGWWLDYDPQSYQIIFPLAGLIGLLSYVKAANIRVRKTKSTGTVNEINFSFLLKSAASLKQLLIENKLFFKYELIFFIYGVGFMVLLPVNVFLFVNYFNMSYKEITFAQTVCFNVGLFSFSFLAGRIFDHYKVIKATGIYFLTLALYPALLLLALTLEMKICLYLAFFVFGIGMSGVFQSWTLSSIKFSGEKDSSTFMGVHVTSVGIRALIGPSIGMLIYNYSSMATVFVTATGFFLLAGYMMFRLKATSENTNGL